MKIIFKMNDGTKKEYEYKDCPAIKHAREVIPFSSRLKTFLITTLKCILAYLILAVLGLLVGAVILYVVMWICAVQ